MNNLTITIEKNEYNQLIRYKKELHKLEQKLSERIEYINGNRFKQ